MKCPSCLVEVNPNFSEIYLGQDLEAHWSVFKMTCPNPDCRILILRLGKGKPQDSMRGGVIGIHPTEQWFVKPLSMLRPPAPPTVESKFANDYREACAISHLSAKASAALSRRCLQNILRDKAGVKNGNLANEIQEIISSGKLPSYLTESIDAIRNIGNFAAHPLKSNSTGEIVDVEPGEAEWLLDVIESLFDFYFVQPSILQTKKDALNAKLKDIGKPQMK